MKKINLIKTHINDVYIINGFTVKDNRGNFSKNFSISIFKQKKINFLIKKLIQVIILKKVQ